MAKEIIDDIVSAENKAKETVSAALKRAEEILAEAQRKAEKIRLDYINNTKKATSELLETTQAQFNILIKDAEIRAKKECDALAQSVSANRQRAVDTAISLLV